MHKAAWSCNPFPRPPGTAPPLLAVIRRGAPGRAYATHATLVFGHQPV